MPMRKRIITTMLAWVALIVTSMATDIPPDVNAVQVTLRDGTTATYKLAYRPTVVFNDDELVLTTTSRTRTSFLLEGHPLFTFIHVAQPTGINNARPAHPMFSLNEEELKAEGLTPGDHFSIYNTKGIQVATGTVNGEGQADIGIQSLAKGVYIIKTTNTTFKILRK